MVLKQPDYHFDLAWLVECQRRRDSELAWKREVGKRLKERVAVEPFRELIAKTERQGGGEVGGEHIQVALAQRVDHRCFAPV